MQQSAIRAPIFAIIIMLVCAYVARAALEIELAKRGFESSYAADLSLLVVPLVLGVLMFPILRSNWQALMQLLSPQGINLRMILVAIAIGLLARTISWSKLVFSASTGLVSSSDPAAIVGPLFSWNCPPMQVFLLGLVVWIVITPVIEEVVHRGLIQSSLMHRGRWTAILVSALIFAAFHPPDSIPFVFLFGIVFAVQFANSQTLWTAIITHATYDGLIQFDWRCLRGTWNPRIEDTPMIETAAISAATLLLSGAAIVWLLKKTGAHNAPRPTH
jgi:membrane protease YdiL (CAAX protease family)